MTNLVLSGARAFGQTLINTAGQVALSYANQTIANLFDNRVFEGPRMDVLRIQSSRDGAPMPHVYGKVRLAGQVIWAARVREIVTEEQQGSKGGGPTSRTYSYTVSFAVGLCEGEILGIGQVWANGMPLQTANINMRVYKGSEEQTADPLIGEIEGEDVPAFRGTAYVVFEDMPLDEFGARLPQLNFEVIRALPRDGDEPALEDLVQGVDLIPGSGEFAYSPAIAEERLGPGTSRAINMNNLTAKSDFDAAIDQLESQLPNCKSVSIIVSWFGDDLRAGHCKLRPGTETRERITPDLEWSVGGETRDNAYLISRSNDRPVYGGTPSDASILAAITALKARGFSVSIYPFILMDISPNNTLPDPYGGAAQAAFPWRGRISCHPAAGQPASADKTASAASQVADFFGVCTRTDFTPSGTTVAYSGPAETGYRRMILHYAHLAELGGGVDSFLIGSEMRGLTTIRDGNNDYPAVAALTALAAEVRSVLSAPTQISYAADWSEYFGHHPQDGTGDVRFHLDPLWASPAIDAVAIDAYFPLADWRDGDSHLDYETAEHGHDIEYLKANIEGGEGYDWYYASEADRNAQIRTPITDGLANKPWVFRYKDIKRWWANPHYDRIGGAEQSTASPWLPQSKPIWFTEIGCPAVDKGANQPNVFFDPKSSESKLPYHSNGARDDLIQRRYIEAVLGYWDEAAGHNPISIVNQKPMVDVSKAHIWCWDARPYPDFPARKQIWSDGENWRLGHWLSGRTGLVSLADIITDICLRCDLPAPDVSRVYGMVSGYMLDRPMSGRGALETLSAAYGVDMIEGPAGLRFVSRSIRGALSIDKQMLAIDDNYTGVRIDVPDPENRLKDVRVSFIDQAHDFQGGSVYAREKLSETVHIMDVGLPIIMDQGQAKLIAQNVLEHAHISGETASFALPPAHLALEPGDIVQIGGDATPWQISSIEGLGALQIGARRAGSALKFNAGSEPADQGPVGWSSAPEGLALDIADFTETGQRTGVLIGALASPWANISVSGPSGATAELTQSILLGETLEDFPAGPVGRYDHHTDLTVQLKSGALASLDEDMFLAGGNILALQTSLGWEIVQCKNAELIAPDTYRLSGFLRGQYGTEIEMEPILAAGAKTVLLPRGFADFSISHALRGLDVPATFRSTARNDFQELEFAYAARHLKPLSPVHAKAEIEGGDLRLNWIRRTRIGGDDWASLDVPLGEDSEQYEIDVMDGEGVLASYSSQAESLDIPLSELESFYGTPLNSIAVNIYQISQTYGRGTPLEFSLSL